MSAGHRNLHTVCDRHGWKCYHCGAAIRCQTCKPNGPGRVATRDHFLPRSAGGKGGPNLVAACWQCNHAKGDAPPGSKPPKRRALNGCQFGRTSRNARFKRPHKPFGSRELADAMVAAVALTSPGVELVAWRCPGCSDWHVTGPRTVPTEAKEAVQ